MMNNTPQLTHIWYGYRQQRIWRAWAFTAWTVIILLSWLSLGVIGLRWYVITGVLVLCVVSAYALGWRDLFSRSPALIMDNDGLKIIGYRHQVLRQFAWEDITGLVSRDDTPVVLTVLHGEKRYTRLLLPRLTYQQVREIQKEYHQIQRQRQAPSQALFQPDFEHIWQTNDYDSITPLFLLNMILIYPVVFLSLLVWNERVGSVALFLFCVYAAYRHLTKPPKPTRIIAHMNREGLTLYPRFRRQKTIFVAWQDLRGIYFNRNRQGAWITIETKQGQEIEWISYVYQNAIPRDIVQTARAVLQKQTPHPKY
ncbi:hypothetical protein [Alysiella filiformis]|nr:hypothetical protein [Alysiella filiformis]QMT30478.1 hypothetical protein H3L97_06865 [Alysiella filiformis]UBQ56540.1 hypothetical protein JF568_01815 [Alysiella filiformis DSM 16848]